MMKCFGRLSDASMVGIEPDKHKEENHQITVYNPLQSVVCVFQTLGLQTGFFSRNRGWLVVPAVMEMTFVLHADPSCFFYATSCLFYRVLLLNPSVPCFPQQTALG